jgi:hypothetical protein
MKKNRHLLLLIFASIIIASCNNTVIFDNKVTFPNANWTFENKAITFKAHLTSSNKPYAIILELELIGSQNVDKINTTFSISSPNGGESVKPIVFNFNTPREPYLKGNSPNEKIYRLTVYPKKYFSETGIYTLIVDQYSNKADNYGIKALRMRIERVKENKKIRDE